MPICLEVYTQTICNLCFQGGTRHFQKGGGGEHPIVNFSVTPPSGEILDYLSPNLPLLLEKEKLNAYISFLIKSRIRYDEHKLSKPVQSIHAHISYILT